MVGYLDIQTCTVFYIHTRKIGTQQTRRNIPDVGLLVGSLVGSFVGLEVGSIVG